MKIDLIGLVVDKINQLGPKLASDFFGVTERTLFSWKTAEIVPSTEACQKVLDEWSASNPPEVWDIKGKKVLILLPMFHNILNGKTHITLIRNYTLYGRDKVAEIPKFRTLIWEARNQLAELALKTDSEDFIMMDSDMLLPCGSGPVLRSLGCDIADPMASQVALSRILSLPSEYKIVSALAFNRHETSLRAACSDGVDSATSNAFLVRCRTLLHDEVKPQRWVGMAFTRIHRSVFEEMKNQADSKLPEIKPSREGRHYGYFTPDRQDEGEDASFCARAAKIGIKSYVDCGLPIGHVGEKIY